MSIDTPTARAIVVQVIRKTARKYRLSFEGAASLFLDKEVIDHIRDIVETEQAAARLKADAQRKAAANSTNRKVNGKAEPTSTLEKEA